MGLEKGGVKGVRGKTDSIPSVDATLVGVLEQRQAVLLIQHPWLPLVASIAHSAQNDFRDLEAGLAQAVPLSVKVLPEAQ